MIGVIIAAGKGGRLSKISGGIPKTLLEVNGKPIIQWIIDESLAAGVRKFFIVTGYNAEKIRDYFDSCSVNNITLIYNPYWEKGNGISVLSVEKLIAQNKMFILMMSDHLIGREVIKAVIKKKRKSPLLAVETNLRKVFDIKDATKVLIEEEKIVSIGKNLKSYNGVDAGLFLLNDLIFHSLKKSIKRGKDSLTAGIKELIKEQKLYAYSIPTNISWIDIDTAESYNKAIQMWRRR